MLTPRRQHVYRQNLSSRVHSSTSATRGDTTAVGYVRWKAEKGLWGSVGAAAKSPGGLLALLVVLPFALASALADGRKGTRQPSPRRNDIFGLTIFAVMFAAFAGACLYGGFFDAHPGTKHPHTLGWLGIALCGVACLFLLAALAVARSGRTT